MVTFKQLLCQDYRLISKLGRLFSSHWTVLTPRNLYRQNRLVPNSSVISLTHVMATHSNLADGQPVFIEEKDRFDCVVLSIGDAKHQCADGDFEERLVASMENWKNTGVRALTVSIPSNLAYRIPQLIKLGFDFHHAKPGYVLMLMWLSPTEPNNFPPYANHYIGVSGFVVNNEGKVLAIKERFEGVKALWKLPGGGADTGEDLAETAKREVFEETGIHCEFVGILAYRHLHKFRYGNSDFYYACLMRATSTEIKRCTQEISEASWLTIEEYSAQLHSLNRFILETYLDYKKTGRLITEHKIMNAFSSTQNSVYRAEQVGRETQNGEDIKTESHL